MFKKNRLVISFLILIMACFLSQVSARVAHQKHSKPHKFERKLIRYLDLSSQQLSKLRAKKMEIRKAKIKTKSEIKILHIDIANELSKENPSEQQVKKLTDKIGELQGKEIFLRAQSVIYLFSLLDSAQRKKLAEFRLEHGDIFWDKDYEKHGRKHDSRGDKRCDRPYDRCYDKPRYYSKDDKLCASQSSSPKEVLKKKIIVNKKMKK